VNVPHEWRSEWTLVSVWSVNVLTTRDSELTSVSRWTYNLHHVDRFSIQLRASPTVPLAPTLMLSSCLKPSGFWTELRDSSLVAITVIVYALSLARMLLYYEFGMVEGIADLITSDKFFGDRLGVSILYRGTKIVYFH